MPTLPAIQLTWRHRVNISGMEASDTAHRALLAYTIKESFIGGGSGWLDGSGSSVTAPTTWTVVASSDGVTANASDNWADETDCIWDTSGDAHSWVVLRHANYFGTGDELEICLDLSEAASTTRGGTMGVYLSRTGFDVSSPVTTARPTAADEVEILAEDGSMTTAAWQGADTNDADHRTGRLHFQMTSDGRNVRVWICRLGVLAAFWDLSRLEDWLTDSSFPAMMKIASRDSDAELATWTIYQSSTYAQWISTDSTAGGDFRARLCMPVASGSNTAVTAMNACNVGGVGSSGLSAIDLQALSPADGVLTTLTDLWIGRQANAGLHYPDDGSRTMAQFGMFVTPWCGQQVNLT